MPNFNRELLVLPDGGTIGLDWDGDIPDPKDKHPKPFLILVPGMSGAGINLYTLAILWQARQDGFKVVTVVARGAGGLPLTTSKMSHCGSWPDYEFAVNHVS